MKNIKYFFFAVFTFSLFLMQSFAQNEQDVEKVKQQIENRIQVLWKPLVKEMPKQ